MAEIRLEDVHKSFPDGRHAVRGIDLEVGDGELVVLVGPSGCGKSTTLRLVAGLERPTAGRIVVGGRDVTDVPPQDRDLAMVFQSYALYPHKTVRDNLAFPLRMRRRARPHIRSRVEAVAATLGLTALLDRKPRELSGGERQRVALGRALVREPQAFLLDEPLSNLDAALRVRTRAELARIHRRLGATMLYVTHDQEEALTLGDRIAVMHEGRLQQVAPPLEVYRTPATRFVAGFIGSPAMSFLTGQLHPANGGAELHVAGLRLRWMGSAAMGRVVVGVRPEDVRLLPPGDGDVVGRVDVVEPLGAALLAHVAMAGAPESELLRVTVAADEPAAEGRDVSLRFRRGRLHLFAADTGARIPGQAAGE